jgi:hypothetical protein
MSFQIFLGRFMGQHGAFCYRGRASGVLPDASETVKEPEIGHVSRSYLGLCGILCAELLSLPGAFPRLVKSVDICLSDCSPYSTSATLGVSGKDCKNIATYNS